MTHSTPTSIFALVSRTSEKFSISVVGRSFSIVLAPRRALLRWFFSDISASNGTAIQKWLSGDKDAFNWSPHFDYVVKTLEGKGEKDAREREEKLRKIAKVVYCDALSPTPMEEGFAGPYDVVIECGCLDAACPDFESFKTCTKTLATLVKRGGAFIRVSPNAIADVENLTYKVGDKELPCIRMTKELVASVLEDSGFEEVRAEFTELVPENARQYNTEIERTTNGYHFISAKKP